MMAEHHQQQPTPAAIAIDVLDMDADAAAADSTAANNDAGDADDSDAGWSSPAPALVDLIVDNADADADAAVSAATATATAAAENEDAAAPTTVAALPPPVATEGEVAQLRAMFPDIPATTLRRVLANHYGHTGLAIDALMELQFYQQDVDDESARRRYRQAAAVAGAGAAAAEPAASGAGTVADGVPSPTCPAVDPMSAADAALAKLRLGDSAAAPPAFYAAAGAVPTPVAAATAAADEPAPTPSAALSAAKATAEAVKSLLWRRPTPISATTTRANKAIPTAGGDDAGALPLLRSRARADVEDDWLEDILSREPVKKLPELPYVLPSRRVRPFKVHSSLDEAPSLLLPLLMAAKDQGATSPPPEEALGLLLLQLPLAPHAMAAPAKAPLQPAPTPPSTAATGHYEDDDPTTWVDTADREGGTALPGSTSTDDLPSHSAPLSAVSKWPSGLDVGPIGPARRTPSPLHMEASDSDVDTTFDDGASNDDDASSLHGPVVRRHRHSRQTSLSVPPGLPPAVAGPGRPLSGATGETKGSNGELSTLTKSTSQDTMATDRTSEAAEPVATRKSLFASLFTTKSSDADRRVSVSSDTLERLNKPTATRVNRKLKLNTVIQSQVSKDRKRFITEKYDLDLTYIVPRIIAMAFPGEGLEVAYRNSLEDVADMLKSEHGDHYMVYNLSERTYDFAKLNHQVLHFGWPDHHAPPLKLLFTICASIDSWLKLDERNVVCIHCKGGKGRTGTVICAYLLYSGVCRDEKEAMQMFGQRRMAADKVGITQPAQKRYIKYYKEIIYREIKLHSQRLQLYRVNLSGVPIVDKKGKCAPFLRIYQGDTLVYATATKNSKDSIPVYGPADGPITFHVDVMLREDVLIQCFDFARKSQKIFRCQFFVGCIDKLSVRFTKEELDDGCKNKYMPADFYMELLFRASESRKSTGHPLDACIPEDMSELDGRTCYFRDQALNQRLLQE